MQVSQYIDHTLLSPQATWLDVAAVCKEAKQYAFYSVCIQPCWVSAVQKELDGSGVKVCTVVGFPLGANTSAVKAFEAGEAVRLGADEVDMVMNIGWAKAGLWDAVREDIAAVAAAVDKKTIVKVILETALLTDEEIDKACACAVSGGAHFVKTSSGFSTGGATVHAVRRMRAAVGNNFGVKASGGIRTHEDLQAMLEAGANRIGASAGVKLLDHNPKEGEEDVY